MTFLNHFSARNNAHPHKKAHEPLHAFNIITIREITSFQNSRTQTIGKSNTPPNMFG